MGLIVGGLALLGFLSGLVLGGGVGAIVGCFLCLVAGETIFVTAASILDGRLLQPHPQTERANDHNSS